MFFRDEPIPGYKRGTLKLRAHAMTAIALDITPAVAPSPEELRANALNHLSRADSLRAQAEQEERLAWRLRADAAMVECARRAVVRPRRRPAISGSPSFSINRVIALMEKLCIDESVSNSDGLDHPLRLVEGHLGICYDARRMPAIGARIAHCEDALAPAPAMVIGNDQ